MLDKLRWLLTRPRAIYRSCSKLGLATTLTLVGIRIRGSKEGTYVVQVPKYPYPITIRGGGTSDAHVLYEILVMDEYASVGSLPGVKFIIDAGANIGMASLYFLNQYSGARVVAVEPDPMNFELCRKNLGPYGDRVTLVNGAVWKSAGRLVLEQKVQASQNRVSAAIEDTPGLSVEAFTVPSLIAYGDGKVDLMKVDIEGSEKELFGPEAQAWLPTVRNLVIELHGTECKNRFLGSLETYQYDMAANDDGDVLVCRNIRKRT